MCIVFFQWLPEAPAKDGEGPSADSFAAQFKLILASNRYKKSSVRAASNGCATCTLYASGRATSNGCATLTLYSSYRAASSDVLVTTSSVVEDSLVSWHPCIDHY